MVLQRNPVNTDTKERCVRIIQESVLTRIFLEKISVIFQCRNKRNCSLYTGNVYQGKRGSLSLRMICYNLTIQRKQPSSTLLRY